MQVKPTLQTAVSVDLGIGEMGAHSATTDTSSHCNACLAVNALGGQGPSCPLGNGRLRTKWQDGGDGPRESELTRS